MYRPALHHIFHWRMKTTNSQVISQKKIAQCAKGHIGIFLHPSSARNNCGKQTEDLRAAERLLINQTQVVRTLDMQKIELQLTAGLLKTIQHVAAEERLGDVANIYRDNELFSFNNEETFSS